MTSFFGSIRNYFDSKYDGRYFSVLLRELAENEGSSFAKLIEQVKSEQEGASLWGEVIAVLKTRDFSVKTEHHFESDGRKRRADVAIVRDKDPLLLMEVKEFDHLQHGNLAQMMDYLAQVKPNLGFIYVYRFAPEPSILDRAKKLRSRGLPVALLTYDQIYSTLSGIDDERAPLARLIRSYMEDIGVGIYRQISLRGADSKSMKFLLSQMLCLRHQGGLGKNQSDESVRAGPDLLKKLDGNIDALSEWIRTQNVELMPNRFSRRFWVNPKFDLAKLKKALARTPESTGQLPPKGPWGYVLGGTVCFEAGGGIKIPKAKGKDQRLQLRIGLSLELTAKSIRPQVYTQFESSNGADLSEITYEESDYLSAFPDESTARRIISETLGRSRKALLKQDLAMFKPVRDLKIPTGH